MIEEIQRVIEKYQDKINKLEELVKIQSELIKTMNEREHEMNMPFISNENTLDVFGEIGQKMVSFRDKISELEKELS